MNLNHLQYHLLSPRDYIDNDNLLLVNKVFSFWKSFWQLVYMDAGSVEAFKIDDFFRQNYICCLINNDDVVGLHLSTFFNLDALASREHTYFKFFSNEYVNLLKQRGVQNVMSIEFLTVNPHYRSLVSGTSFGRLLLLLGQKLFEESHADAIVAPARKDNNAHKMAYKIGFECIISDTMQRNFPCDLVACFKGKANVPDDLQLKNMLSQLWESKNSIFSDDVHKIAS